MISLDNLTIGDIDASGITTINGYLSALLTLHNSSSVSISGLEDMDYVLTDTSLNDINGLITLDLSTNGTINASSIISITGSISDSLTLYETQYSITGLDNVDIVLTDQAISDISLLNDLDNLTNGTIDASSVTSVSGDTADINTALSSTGIIGLLQLPPIGVYPPNYVIYPPPSGTYPPNI